MPRMKSIAFCLIAVLASCPAICSNDLLIRPTPQIIQESEGGFVVGEGTRIVVPESWPSYVRASADELAQAIQEAFGLEIEVVEVERPEIKKGDIVVGPYEWLRRQLGFVEPMPQGIVRPAPSEGYNIRTIPDNILVAGNSPRGCFMGLQTLIQIAKQLKGRDDRAFPGMFVADWPDHDWRTLQHPFGVYGHTYDRGEHRYRHITKVDLLERSI